MATAYTTGDWFPLSARESKEELQAYDALHLGVPPWLRDSLWEWIEPQVSWSTPRTSRRAVDQSVLRLLERLFRFETGWDTDNAFSGLSLLESKVKSDSRLMLDIVDYLIGHTPPNHSALPPEELDKLLEEAGSAYKVDTATQPPALIRRVDVTIEAAAKLAMEQKEAPSALLRLAWNTTYGLRPNPSDGYRQAVRAVEAAAIPVVLPNDGGATLGKVIGTIRGGADRWQLSFTHRTKPEAPIETYLDDGPAVGGPVRPACKQGSPPSGLPGGGGNRPPSGRYAGAMVHDGSRFPADPALVERSSATMSMIASCSSIAATTRAAISGEVCR
jgi:hypothetical protein